MAIAVNITADTSEFSKAISKASHDTQKFDRLNNAAAKTFQELAGFTDKQANSYRTLVTKIEDVTSSTASLTSKQAQLRSSAEKLRKLYGELADKESSEARSLKNLIKETEKQAQAYRNMAQAQDKAKKSSGGLTNQMMSMGAQVVSVTAVFNTLKEIVNANEASFDDLNRQLEQGASWWRSFLSGVGQDSSWSDWINNMSAVNKQAAKLYDTMDRLGSMRGLNSASIAALDLEIKKMEQQKKLGNSIDEARLKSLRDRLKLLKQEQVEQEKLVGKERIKQALMEKGMTGGMAGVVTNQIISQTNQGQNINSYFEQVRRDAVARMKQLGIKDISGGYNPTALKLKDVADNQLKANIRILNAESGVADGLKSLTSALNSAAANISGEIAVDKWKNKGTGGKTPKNKPIVLDNEDDVEDVYDESWAEYLKKQREEIDREYNLYKTEIKQNEMDILNSQVQFDLDMKEEIQNLSKELEKAPQEIVGNLSTINSSLGGIYDTMKNLDEIDNPFDFFDSLFGVAQQIQQVTNAIQSMSEVSAMASKKRILESQQETTADTISATGKVFKAHADIPFVGVAIATAMAGMMIASMVSQKNKAKSLPKFANGGIVGGNSYIGDMNIARVNSGEMILNTTQQRRLFNLLNGKGGMNDMTNSNQTVELIVRGQDLVGVIDNYNKKLKRVR